MKSRDIIALVLMLLLGCSPAIAQVNPGTSPLSGAKGGTNNGFMQFTGPATSLKTYTLPNASGSIAMLNQIQTWTAAQSFADGTLVLLGSGSGSSTLKAPATGGGTATLFPGTDTVAGLAAAQALTNKTINCASNSCTVRVASDISGLGTGVATALGINVGSAGAVIVNGGAGGTPSSVSLTNGTGLPVTGLVNDPTAWSFLGNPTAGSASYAPFTIGSLTNKPSPATTDLLVLQDASTGALRNCQITQCVAAVSSGVTSFGGQTGPIAVGTNLSMSGTTVNANGVQNRQSILSSSVISSTGSPNFANPGTGLNVNLTATATPFTASWAAGFSATAGAIDFVGQLSADVASYWPSLPANQYSFLSVDRNAGTGVLTATQTLVRPQKGPVFYAPRQALLHFENNLTDDWGNALSSSGATFTAPCAKFGSFGLSLSGTASYTQSAQILNPGQGNWTMHVWASVTSNVSASIMSVGNAYGVYVATNASGKLVLFLSSGGASWDISPGSSPGATTVTAGTFHHFALVYNGASYVLYLDGVAQLTVSSPAIIWPEGVAMTVGNQAGASAPTAGCWDELEFLPYAKWVANFTPPVAASAVSGDWFDTNQMVMKTASGAGPTWTAVQRLYVAEAASAAASVSAVYNYSPVLQFRSGAFALNPGTGLTRVGNHVTFAAASQFITNWGLSGTSGVSIVSALGAPYTWVIPPSVVPPDATYLYIQVQVAHAAIDNNSGAGPGNQDCTFVSRLPVGIVQNSATIWTAYSNFTGMATPTNTTAFTEGAGPIIQVPIINGIAAIETIINGSTCAHGGANAAILKQAVVVGYDMP